MVDRYHMGRIVRLNPEKHAAPLLNVSADVEFPGGAGNVAMNVMAMGAKHQLVCQRFGDVVKVRLVDESDGVVARFDIEGECFPAIPEEIVKKSEGCCAVLVADYGKGAIDAYVRGQIRALELPTFVDAKYHPDLWVDWAEVMFPNYAEYLAHRKVYNTAKICVVKCGSEGAHLLFGGLRSSEQFPSKATCVRNVAGAGDTVLASFACAYMALEGKYSPAGRAAESLRMAMDFAAAAVAGPTTTAPSFADAYPYGVPGAYLSIQEALRK